MAVREISKQSIKELEMGIQSRIQARKVALSRRTISELQSSKRFALDKDIVSYNSTVNAKNRSPNLKRFYLRMLDSPKNWRGKFIHIRTDGGTDNSLLAEASMMAYNLVYQQTIRSYPGKYTTTRNRTYGPSAPGLSSFIHAFVNGAEVQTSGAILGGITKSTGPAQFEITNTADYASTQEAFTYMTVKGFGGIIYYAAQRVQKAYPQLAVLFYYADSADFGISSHHYALPVLTISSAQTVFGRERTTRARPFKANKWATPGVNIKTRRRVRNRIRRQSGVTDATIPRTFDRS